MVSSVHGHLSSQFRLMHKMCLAVAFEVRSDTGIVAGCSVPGLLSSCGPSVSFFVGGTGTVIISAAFWWGKSLSLSFPLSLSLFPSLPPLPPPFITLSLSLAPFSLDAPPPLSLP